MKVTTEKVKGNLSTILWHIEAFDDFYELEDGVTISLIDCENCIIAAEGDTLIAIALPALPRKPVPKETGLIREYLAKGLQVHAYFERYPKKQYKILCVCGEGFWVDDFSDEPLLIDWMDVYLGLVTCEKTGEKVEVAINEEV